MGYKVGMSSGMFGTAQGKEKMDYLTVLKKIMWSATKGVTFAQLDLESITEFGEPHLMDEVKKIKSLGIEFGIHGEMGAMGMKTMTLDSAKPTEYRFSHIRLMEHIRGSGKMNAKYCLVHASESQPLILLESHDLAPAVLVDIWGRPFNEFLENHPELVEWGIKQQYLMDVIARRLETGNLKKAIEKETEKYRRHYEKEKKEFTQKVIDEVKQDVIDTFRKELKSGVYSQNQAYGPERAAYILIAKWMCSSDNCPNELKRLWKNIVGNKTVDEIGITEFDKWCPAVSAAYIWGHFMPETCPKKSQLLKHDYEDPKPLLEKYKLIWVFETAMPEKGYEGHIRLGRIPDMYYLTQAIKSPWLSVALDAEHLLSCNFDPKKEVEALPYGAGKNINVIHMGFPTPHAPAHVPISVGSKAQVYWYELLFELRKKGMEDAFFIFERAGLDVVDSTVAIKLIAQNLEKDVKPKDLPLEFFGMAKMGPEIARQRVAIKEHFLDPIKGMLSIPEEEHGLLSSKAKEKGKLEDWAKEKYK
ncbi:MAG: hypothetical protein ISS95_00785 [Candidatus Aenigmarchaeota archaeon]|nr:hypothetical protein [Candidatus Aenigmarchaeota archaeon]